jgi:hypothetical protein
MMEWLDLAMPTRLRLKILALLDDDGVYKIPLKSGSIEIGLPGRCLSPEHLCLEARCSFHLFFPWWIEAQGLRLSQLHRHRF